MAFSNLRGKRLNIVLGVVGATCFALQGYDQAVANGLLTLPTWVAVFPQIDTISSGLTKAQKSHNSTLQGTTVALYEVGCAIGALSCAFIGDFLGRRKTVFIAGWFALVGIILQTTPFELGQLIAGRMITGLGIGAFTATVPMWVSECTKAYSRGRFVLLEGWFAIGGIVIATWIEFGMFYVTNSSVNWRFPIAFQSIFAIIILTFVPFLPESPRWLVKKDRIAEAGDALGKLDDLPTDSEVVTAELGLIQEGLQAEMDISSASPFSNGVTRNLNRTALAILINLLAQMSGVNIITFYSTTIFQEEGYSPTIARVISGCLQIWQFVAAGLAVLAIDRFGRRKLLLAAAIGMMISQAGLAGLTYSTVDLKNKAAAGASLLFYFGALFWFPVGLFLVPFIYAAEIAPLRSRSKVTAMSASVNWLFNFLIAEVTPIGFNTIGYKYYIIYACINAFTVAIVYFFFPETKGRTLEEIDEIFIQSNNVFDPVKMAKILPMGVALTTGNLKDIELEKAGIQNIENVDEI